MEVSETQDVELYFLYHSIVLSSKFDFNNADKAVKHNDKIMSNKLRNDKYVSREEAQKYLHNRLGLEVFKNKNELDYALTDRLADLLCQKGIDLNQEKIIKNVLGETAVLSDSVLSKLVVPSLLYKINSLDIRKIKGNSFDSDSRKFPYFFICTAAYERLLFDVEKNS